MDPLTASARLASAGMEVQSLRLRVVAENIANAQSTGVDPGSDPYQRKTITFRSELDRAAGAATVGVREIGVDRAPFRVEHEPGNPAADENGDVKYPNVNVLIEMTDMREANRSYEANLQMIKQARALVASVIDLLKS
ncbi:MULTISPECIES: flagellar basal body rod protein FlgC [unclassified Methylobacterium]|uniref:flagellar basal body rod protein FlgC n=1 Tax=unclassified Methylobacterium TaxID=2615210 RepID=UPI0018DFF455|nr:MULTISPECIES: flagellar basal body rod protein FlgC [Methylobacterium]WFT83602.1 flagellar basal body rod protein FlgC [Methylobacterium nodulans]